MQSRTILNSACALVGAVGLVIVAVAACDPADQTAGPVIESVPMPTAEPTDQTAGQLPEVIASPPVTQSPVTEPPTTEKVLTPPVGQPPVRLEPTPELSGQVDPASIAAALATPCELEDSVNCYWRADLRGNGIGTSFVNVEGHTFPLTSVLAG